MARHRAATSRYKLPGRPRRSEFKSDVEFIRAVHEFNQKITNAANAAFDDAFRKAMRKR